MSLSSALVSSEVSPDAETEVSSPQSPTTSGSPVTPPRYPTAELSSGPRKLRPSTSRAQRLETFEDLLKEAGYSHTRVITPKAERLAKDAATYSSHTRDDSNDKGVNGADSALTGVSRYGFRMANFLAWVSGSTSAAAVECGDSHNDPADDSKHPQITQRDDSPTPKGVRTSKMDTSLPHSSSGRRLQPKPRHPTSSSNEIPFDSISPSISSDTIIATSTTTSTMTVRPLKPRPPMRQTSSSPQLKQSSPLGTTGSNTPNFLGSRRVPSHRSNQGSHRSNSGKTGSSRPNKRSPLPDTWKDVSRSTGRTPRRRCPSERLLARSGSLSLSTSNAAAAATQIQAMTSPVTVSCRSSSVGATTRHRRKKELPLLTPSAEPGAWPWPMDTGNNGNGGKVSPLPKINIHAANGKRIARTGSSSSARGFSSLSRNGSAYTTFSRVGSNSPYASISKAGTSGMASSNRGAGEENSWADYSHRNSPIVAGFKHLPHPNLYDKEHADEGDDDSGDEPHLSNILAPHLSPMADPKPSATDRPGPVGRQRSIQSLRACLRRHESVGASPRIASPKAVTYTVDQAPAAPVLSLPLPMHAGPNSPKPDNENVQSQAKRRSMGNYDQRRGHDTDVAPFRRKDNRMLGDERGARRVEAVGVENETNERGRTDSRGLLRLGLNGLAWPTSSSRSPPYSTPPPPSGVRGTRTSSTPARGHDKRGKKDDKMNQKELERERLLWGTSWGHK